LARTAAGTARAGRVEAGPQRRTSGQVIRRTRPCERNKTLTSPTMPPALLVLEDGTVFSGIGIGAEGLSVGEVVFNTAMTGYQEILTDPSYASQIVTLTYPHIGNTGTTPEDD